MTEPNRPIPQRIGDAERDQAIDCLREHLAQGRLDQAEFDERMEQALSARTQNDIDPLFLDLPAPKPNMPRPEPVLAPQPAAQLRVRPEAQTDRRNLQVALGTLAAIAWPLAIMLMIVSNGHAWFLWIIPLMFTTMFGRYRHDRRR